MRQDSLGGTQDSFLNRLIRVHNFFAGQLFYPILLSTLLALGMYAVRVVISDSWRIYANLVWNLFLAWIPYGLSIVALWVYNIAPRRWWLLVPVGVVWMAFFPNAPYLVTDFLHLEQRAYIPLWYDILMLVTFSWTGVFLAIASMRTMHWLVARYLGRILGWLFAAAALALGGLGIYLGRFERWNSWDLLTHPERIVIDTLKMVANPLDNMRFVAFTLLFTAFLAVCYLTFVAVHRVPYGGEAGETRPSQPIRSKELR